MQGTSRIKTDQEEIHLPSYVKAACMSNDSLGDEFIQILDRLRNTETTVAIKLVHLDRPPAPSVGARHHDLDP